LKQLSVSARGREAIWGRENRERKDTGGNAPSPGLFLLGLPQAYGNLAELSYKIKFTMGKKMS
jgi:hypothetical protein